MSQLRVLNELEAVAGIERVAVLEALSTAFAGLNTGASVQPTQTVTAFPDGKGDSIFYPGALLDLGLIGVKVSPYLQALADKGEYPVTAYTLLLSSETGLPLLLCDSYALTTMRTAGTTALAVRYLASAGATKVAIVGSGKAAKEHLRFVESLDSGLLETTMWSPRIADRRADLEGEFPNLKIGMSAEGAVRDADVVLLCTSSATPVVDRSWIKDGALVTSISTNSPGAHEIDPVSLATYEVYCDYRATAPVTAGEMQLAANDGWSPDSIAGDLAELISGASSPSSATKFFRSTGLGIEDLAIASLLFK